MQFGADRVERDRNPVSLQALCAVIAHSQIVVAEPRRPATALPAGFDATDIAILDWIAASSRRLGRSFMPMPM